MLVVNALILGGAEGVVLEVAAGLAAAGASVVLVTTDRAAHDWQDRFRPHVRQMWHLGWVRADTNLAYLVAAYAKAAGAQTIVVSNTAVGIRIAPALKLALPDVPLVAIVHGTDRQGKPFPGQLCSRAGAFDSIVAVSEHVRRSVVNHTESDPSAVAVIHNGVEAGQALAANPARYRAMLGVADGRWVISYIGRLSHEKHPEMAVQLARRLLERGVTKFVVAVAGGGAMEGRVRALIQALGVSGHVQLIGQIRDPLDLIAASDVVCMFSEYEGLPLTALEAAMVGRPILATAVGGLPEVVAEGVNGWLLPHSADLPDQMADLLVQVLTDRERLDKMGRAGRELALERFTLQQMLAGYLDVLGISNAPPAAEQ